MPIGGHSSNAYLGPNSSCQTPCPGLQSSVSPYIARTHLSFLDALQGVTSRNRLGYVIGVEWHPHEALAQDVRYITFSRNKPTYVATIKGAVAIVLF